MQRAVDAGIVVVAAAGNFGKTADGRPIVGGIVSPGNSPAALTVGALNTKGTAERSDDVMATYSSRGPTLIDGVVKPELVAPGNRIVSASADESYFERSIPRAGGRGPGAKRLHRDERHEHVGGGGLGRGGAAARGQPALTPAEVKLLLQLTSSRVAGAGLIEAGAGSLNIAAAVAVATSGSIRIVTSTIAGELSLQRHRLLDRREDRTGSDSPHKCRAR